MDNGTCEISVATRNACRYCRFQRCIKVGMSVEGNLNDCLFNYLDGNLSRKSNWTAK